MKLKKEVEQSLRILIKKAEPALKAYKKELEEDLDGKAIPSSLLYEQVFSALVHLSIVKDEIMLMDGEQLNFQNKKQGKLFE
jgi:hypothetical protein